MQGSFGGWSAGGLVLAPAWAFLRQRKAFRAVAGIWCLPVVHWPNDRDI
jgi:hypothetical protein